MTIDFVDTSIIVTASTQTDSRHDSCVRLLTGAKPGQLACATHSLAEVFAILSGRPRPLKLSPVEAGTVVSHIKKTLTLVTLTSGEYLDTVESLARLGHSGGMIYDALLMACARKIKARRIYTLNEKHFRLAAPDLATRVRLP